MNLYNFGDGYLKFRIKIPSNVAFQIGIIDAWGNQSYVEFPSGQTKYGLVRNGDWGQASIPVEDIRGEYIDLRMLSYEFVILEVNGVACEFALDDIYWDGGGNVSVFNDGENLVSNNYMLHNSYPNPFNPTATIQYDLPLDSQVKLEIYDVSGRKVRTLVDGPQTAGSKSVQWDARDVHGRAISAGLYLYTLNTGKYTKTNKMVFLK